MLVLPPLVYSLYPTPGSNSNIYCGYLTNHTHLWCRPKTKAKKIENFILPKTATTKQCRGLFGPGTGCHFTAFSPAGADFNICQLIMMRIINSCCVLSNTKIMSHSFKLCRVQWRRIRRRQRVGKGVCFFSTTKKPHSKRLRNPKFPNEDNEIQNTFWMFIRTSVIILAITSLFSTCSSWRCFFFLFSIFSEGFGRKVQTDNQGPHFF